MHIMILSQENTLPVVNTGASNVIIYIGILLSILGMTFLVMGLIKKSRSQDL